MSVLEITFNITLLNARSLRKHYKDIMKDTHLLSNDVLCLTETQLQIDEDTSYIESSLQENFKIHFNSNENRYRSIAFCYSDFVSLLTYEDDNGICTLTVTKPKFYEYPITAALVLSIPNTLVAGFLDQLIYFTNARKIDILLGDFNIDAFDSDASAKLHDIVSYYRLVVKEPTHLDGALLDHVYLYKLFPSKNVNAVVKNVYFSDHDAVKLQVLVGGSDDIHFKKTM